jgi:hypothetical protein
MRHAMLSFAVAALAGALALSAPGKSLAGDPYAYGTYEADYGADGYGYGDGGWYDNVRRDGNVFYNAYNSYDGYDRHRYGGYWERPYDGYGYGSGYGYGCDGDCAGYGYGNGYYSGRYDRSAYPRRNGKFYYPDYGDYDPSHHEIRHTRRRIECESNGVRFYAGRCY